MERLRDSSEHGTVALRSQSDQNASFRNDIQSNNFTQNNNTNCPTTNIILILLLEILGSQNYVQNIATIRIQLNSFTNYNHTIYTIIQFIIISIAITLFNDINIVINSIINVVLMLYLNYYFAYYFYIINSAAKPIQLSRSIIQVPDPVPVLESDRLIHDNTENYDNNNIIATLTIQNNRQHIATNFSRGIIPDFFEYSNPLSNNNAENDDNYDLTQNLEIRYEDIDFSSSQ